MKKNLIKVGILLIAGFMAFNFTSCAKDDDESSGTGSSGSGFKIIANNVDGDLSRITHVSASVYYENESGDGNETIAKTELKSKGFTLVLPNNAPNKVLFSIVDGLGDDVSISDKSAKIVVIEDINGLDSKGNILGFFSSSYSQVNKYYSQFWMFADKDVTIKGTDEDTYGSYVYINEFDLKLKKGWNVVYTSDEESEFASGESLYVYKLTTQSPSGVDFKWEYYDYSEN